MTVAENNFSQYVSPKLGGFATKVSWYARQQMFDLLMALANPSAGTTVLDVGVIPLLSLWEIKNENQIFNCR